MTTGGDETQHNIISAKTKKRLARARNNHPVIDAVVEKGKWLEQI